MISRVHCLFYSPTTRSCYRSNCVNSFLAGHAAIVCHWGLMLLSMAAPQAVGVLVGSILAVDLGANSWSQFSICKLPCPMHALECYRESCRMPIRACQATEPLCMCHMHLHKTQAVCMFLVVMTQAHSIGELLEAHICNTYGVA
jgi:hypothetical protein